MTEQADDELLKKVMVSLRTSTTDAGLKGEITDLITAAKADLKVNGIISDEFSTANDNTPLITLAIQLYVKGHWGYDNPDADRLLAQYEALKTELSLHSQYGGDSSAV